MKDRLREGRRLSDTSRACAGPVASNLSLSYPRAIDEEKFESLLDQVRELHRIADELTREPQRLHAHVRARLHWERDPPSLPPRQRDVADKAVEALTQPRLTAGQSRELYRVFFGK